MRVQEFERVSERALSANELAAYWRHLDQVSNATVRTFLRVALLLGGQRIAQLARLRDTDINLESRIITLQDSKGRDGKPRDHLLPLTERVQQILADAPQVGSAEGWIFTTAGRASLRPETVSTAVAEYSAWLEKNASIKPFSARDLRRTCETRLAELGVSKQVRAQLLSHGISGVQAKHYDCYEYLPEKREALTRWEAYLQGLLDPERKIVHLATRKNRRKA